jgi:hypothetical protein
MSTKGTFVKLSNCLTEAIFFYHGTALQGYVRPMLQQATATLEQVAPTFTPFVFAELVIKDQYFPMRFAAFSMIALSEGSQNRNHDKVSVSLPIPEALKGIITLAHLISTSSRDMERHHVRAQISEQWFITASIGICFYPDDGVDKHSLLKNEDIAVNMAKKSGGNRIQFYAAKMNEETLYRLEMEGYLRKALEKTRTFSLLPADYGYTYRRHHR